MSCKSDLGQSKTGIFFQEGLDDPNHVDPLQQIRFLKNPGSQARMALTVARRGRADEAIE
jgi:hypothetical protein